jgi:hypothetical protein
MIRVVLICFVFVAVAWAAHLATSLAEEPAGDGTDASTQPADTRRFEPLMREIAAGYERWGRVDDEARWAPFLCRMPSPGSDRLSASDDKRTHGRKIYALYAKDRNAYVGLNDALPKDLGWLPANPAAAAVARACEQVIVKEAYLPVEVSSGAAWPTTRIGAVESDGKWYRHGDRTGLFIMAKVSANDPDADAGWVYGTVSPDRKTVTAVGRIDSCMSCHTEAPHGRLFGLPK